MRALVSAAGLALALVACDDVFHYNKGGHGGGGGGDDSPDDGRYHPDGWAAPGVHGLAAKLHEQTCTDCHGPQLDGAFNGVSCDGCHPSGWREDCTFCHGGERDATGAPPADIDPDDGAEAFPPHHRHVTENTHAPFDCTTCHASPTDVLTPGHLFDDTPGVAEVHMGVGLSPWGVWTGTGCSTVYCHGDGRAQDGAVQVDDGPLGCGDCHAGMASGRDGWAQMSGEHEEHLREGLDCGDCHGDTTADGSGIATPALHVDGAVQVVIGTSGFSFNGTTCSGSCHGEPHSYERWE